MPSYLAQCQPDMFIPYLYYIMEYHSCRICVHFEQMALSFEVSTQCVWQCAESSTYSSHCPCAVARPFEGESRLYMIVSASFAWPFLKPSERAGRSGFQPALMGRLGSHDVPKMRVNILAGSWRNPLMFLSPSTLGLARL
jgi:hypothetical protein